MISTAMPLGDLVFGQSAEGQRTRNTWGIIWLVGRLAGLAGRLSLYLTTYLGGYITYVANLYYNSK
jgi:hypothetical protein